MVCSQCGFLSPPWKMRARVGGRFAAALVMASSCLLVTVGGSVLTEVTGQVVVTERESPVEVHDHLDVPEDSSLLIGPGVEVRLKKGVGIDVVGELVVNGTEDRRVLFTVLPRAADPSPAARTGGVRLVPTQEQRHDKGILNVWTMSGNSTYWKKVCDYRSSSSSSLKSLAKVVCYQLGMAYNPAAKVIRAPKQPRLYVMSLQYHCIGNEERLSECHSLYRYCDFGRNTLIVVCDSKYRDDHWGSVRVHGNKTSVLQYVDFTNGGMEERNNITYQVPTVRVEDADCLIRNVKVSNSGHDGLGLHGMNRTFSIENLETIGNFYNGLQIDSYLGNGSLTNITATGNGKHGIMVKRIPITDFEGSDFCQITCVRCEESPENFPLKYFVRKHSRSDKTCEKSFSTAAGWIIGFFLVSSSGKFHLSIRDGFNTDSPFIWRAQMSTSNRPNPMPVVTTKSNAIIIKIVFNYYQQSLIQFMLFSVYPSSLGMMMNNVNAFGNRGSGIFLNKLQFPVEVKNTHLKNNSVGINITNSSLKFASREGLVTENKEIGIDLYQSDGMVLLEDVKIFKNRNFGVRYIPYSHCRDEKKEELSMHLHCLRTRFDGNLNAELHFEAVCHVNLTLSECLFSNGNFGVNFKESSRNNQLVNYIIMKGNVFKNFTGPAVRIVGHSSLVCSINNNTFFNNQHSCINITKYIYSTGKQINVTFKGNQLQNNTARTSLVSFVVYSHNYKNLLHFNITNNVFLDNSVSLPISYYKFSLKHLHSILFLKLDDVATISRNVFQNPKTQFQICTSTHLGVEQHDARYNFWGSTNIKYIADTIMARHQQYVLKAVEYFPFCYNATCLQFDMLAPRYPDFVQGYHVGGILFTNVSLTDTSQPYYVSKDIIINQNRELHIGKGVQLQFQIGIGILSFGTLTLEGEPGREIQMFARDWPQSDHVRLINGSKPNYGIVQVKHNGKWHSMCHGSHEKTTLHFLCQEAGFKEMLEYSTVISTSEHKSLITCSSIFFHECKIENSPSNCSSVIFLSCRENYWCGIHLAVDAAPSLITYVNISNTGLKFYGKSSQSAVHVDLFHHVITNINIVNSYNDSNTYGLTILKTNTILKKTLSGINIQISNIGLKSADSRLHVENSFFKTQRTGIYVNPSIFNSYSMKYANIKKNCYSKKVFLKPWESLFIKISKDTMARYSTCNMIFETENGSRIALQVVDGIQNVYQRFKIFNGYKNKGTPIFPVPDVNGYSWTTSDSVMELLVYWKSYGNSILYITSYTGDPDNTTEFSVQSSTIEGRSAVHIVSVFNNVSFLNTTIMNSSVYGLFMEDIKGKIRVSINKCSFSKNKKAILLNLHNLFLVVNLSESSFRDNDVAFEVNYWDRKLRKIIINMVKNKFIQNRMVISLNDNINPVRQYWNILDNTFIGHSGVVMSLRGLGNVSHNTFYNNTSPKEIIRIFTRNSDEIFQFSSNRILQNKEENVGAIMSIYTVNSLVTIKDNIFGGNQLCKSVLSYMNRKPNVFKQLPVFENNTIVGNFRRKGCRKTSAFYLGGTQTIEGSGNVFDNIELDYEVDINAHTLNSSSHVNLTRNFWGSNVSKEIAVKFYDGANGKQLPIIYYVPYYVSQLKTTLLWDERPSVTITGSVLAGRILHSLVLSDLTKTYIVTSDLVVPSGVSLTLQPGVLLHLTSGVGITIYGQLLARGTLEKPIIIQQANVSFKAIRLVDGNSKFEGRLEVKYNGSWRLVCSESNNWNSEAAYVACKQLGFGSVLSSFKRFKYKQTPMYLSFDCLGTEKELSDCKHMVRNSTCYYRRIVGIVCSGATTESIHFASSDSSAVSSMENVILKQIGSLQVSGTPPNMRNIVLEDSYDGLVYLGSGAAREKDIILTNVSIKKVKRSGISLYDILSNVTLDTVTVMDAGQHGIYFSPVMNSNSLLADHRHTVSTFRFCDSEQEYFIRPNEELKFFQADAQDLSGCKQVFTTSPGYSVKITLKKMVTTDSVEIFEGKHRFFKNRIAHGKSELMEVTTWSNVMAVTVAGKESSIMYAAVGSVRGRSIDCSFEHGFCGWHNVDDIFSVERGKWSMYSCLNGTSDQFYGMAKDTTFSNGNQGHYIYAGSRGSGCYYSSKCDSISSLIESPEIVNTNLCFVTFYYYRHINYYNKRRLSLFVRMKDHHERIWSSSVAANSWQFVKVSLEAIGNADKFSLLFNTQYALNCRNSIGLDDIKFIPCPQEKHVSTISLINVRIHQISNLALWIQNNDPIKHNVIWIERTSIHHAGQFINSIAIGLHLRSAYVLIRNTDLYNVSGHGIKIIFSSLSPKRVSDVSIVQNSIQYSRNGGAIYVKNDRGVKHANSRIEGNDIRHCSGKDSVVQVVNTSLVMDGNILFNNSGRFVLELGNNIDGVLNKLPQICVNNTFWLNRAQQQAAEYTVSISATQLSFHDNVLNNPANLYELSLRIGVPVNATSLNATGNWWGTGLARFVVKKIRHGKNTKGIPELAYVPFLTRLPTYFGLSSSCPLGWIRKESKCYLYQGGAVTYLTAFDACQRRGSLLLSSDQLLGLQPLIYKLTKYRDIDATYKNALIWLNTLTSGFGQQVSWQSKCFINHLKQNGNKIVEKSCLNLYPFICQKPSIVDCENGCYQNGLCLGLSCLCNKGWEKKDCSKFHCRDVNYCSGHGQCVGPNYCNCKPGWMGQSCTVSYCSRYGSCQSCTPKTGCGWCDISKQCLPGDKNNPDEDVCSTWFYHKCLTMEASTECSGQIAQIACGSRYCNTSLSDVDKGNCQRCRDIEKCFKLALNRKCYIWNEKKCPNGKIVPDYSDPQRINNTVFDDNLQIVQPDAVVLFACPSYQGLDASDEHNLYIVEGQVNWKPGTVIASAQSGGVFHKLNTLISADDFTLISAQLAGLNEAIKYADFQQELILEEIGDDLTEEHISPESLINGYLEGTVNLTNGLIHTVLPEVPLYKCVGHEYHDTNGRIGNSFYLVMEKSQSTNYNTGDYIVSNRTDGFLETVTRISLTRLGTFVKTNLTQCFSSAVWNPQIKLNAQKRDMSCYGGDNWPGLLFFENLTANFQIGDVVSGRESAPVFAQIVNISEISGNVFLEVVGVDSVSNGSLQTTLEIHRLSSGIRIRKKRDLSFEKSDATSLTWDSGSASVSISAGYTIGMTLSLDIDFLDTKVKKAGVTLSGSANFEVSASVYIAGEPKLLNIDKLLYSKQSSGRIFVIFVSLIPIPGRRFFHLEARFQTNLKGKGSITGNLFSMSSRFSTGAEWKQSSGSKQKSPKVTGSKTSYPSYKFEGEAFVGVKMIPMYRIQWPSVLSSGKIKDKNTFAGPDKIKLEFEKCAKMKEAKFCHKLEIETAVRDEMTSFEISFRFPGSAGITGKICDVSCTNPDQQTKVSVEAKLDALELAISAFVWDLVFRYPVTFLGWTFKKNCLSNFAPCCSCPDGKPGKLDPATKECLCQCFCDPPLNTVKSVKKLNEECKCDKCPDESLQLWTEQIKCPCTCADGNVKEMEKDGTCKCDCTCEDGTSSVMADDGTCICECVCKNCETSTIGPSGCRCPNDSCPVCPVGVVPMWKNCECECSKEPCGESLTCANGRTGSDCQQPYCKDCSLCSGNGVCSLVRGGCSSRCNCHRQWQGRCCERRRPRRAFGDPHLETLDGVEFDYFGIGQFWDCKSELNDFGYQVRYFYYKQTSFTGAIAVKMGESVATITTPPGSLISSLPVLRIDGHQQNISKPWQKTFSNGSVLLNVQPSEKTGSQAVAIVLLSFEFKNGARLTLDVRHSTAMDRQFINVLFGPTASFRHNTSGLCGLMDDDTSNDLMGPNGTLYNNTVTFVEAWRIGQHRRTGAGLYGSWSWTGSNFHADDVWDRTYYDPTYTPVYSLTGFTQNQIIEATRVCVGQGVSGNLLDGCIYDVVITNDTLMAEQETLKVGCPDQCSGKGRCLNNSCMCVDGWTGDKCQIGACGLCFHGNCISGFCKCKVGWEGADCSQRATCINVNNCTDEKHGVCLTTDRCLCADGFVGADCSVIPSCIGRENCSGNGLCVGADVCKCHTGWKGDICNQYSCENLNHCSGNGTCIGFDVCMCKIGWKGLSCSLADCTSVRDCSGNGTCVQPDTCECNNGFSGDDCSQLISCPSLNSCTQHGICISSQNAFLNGTKKASTKCRCFLGFTGEECSIASCESMNNCSGHGVCVEPNVCSCEPGYSGQDCMEFSCDTKNRCSGHGNCTAFEVCTCNDGWSGDACDAASCLIVDECSSQGQCIAPNRCQCYDGFQGVSCNETLGSNRYPPVFNQSSYEANITEITKPNTVLLQVHATDGDTGMNGKVRYSYELSRLNFDATKYLVIDGDSGVVVLTASMSRNLVPAGHISLSVIASDQGVPALTAKASFVVNIEDINDHCPEFRFPASSSVHYINSSAPANTTVLTVSASDDDFGLNGEVTYNIKEPHLWQIFFIGSSGNITIRISPIPVKNYIMTVTATDLGVPACTKEEVFSILVLPSDVKPFTTAVPPTSTKAFSTASPPPVSSSIESTTSTTTTQTTSRTSSYLVSFRSSSDSSTKSSLDSSTKSSPIFPSTSPYPVDSVTKSAVTKHSDLPMIIGIVLGVTLFITIISIIVLWCRLRSLQQTLNNYKKMESVSMDTIS